MVVAIKRAVGSEYQYQHEAYLPKENTAIKTRTKKKTSPFVMTVIGVFCVAVIFCGGLSFLYIKAATAKMNFDIAGIKKTNQEIIVQNEKLRLEIAKLKSLDRIEALASANLGMIKSSQAEYLVMSKPAGQAKNSAGSPTPAAVAQAQVNAGTKPEAQKRISSGEEFLQNIESLVFNKS